MRIRPLPLLFAALCALLVPALPALARYGAPPLPLREPVNILLAGVAPNYPESPVWPYPKAPEDFTGLADTIVLAQFRAGSVRLLHIPRDSWVNIAGWGEGKINSANPRGGIPLLRGTVEGLTGLKVHGVALLSLDAVPAVGRAAGGVTLNVPQRMLYEDRAAGLSVDLHPGRQHLSAEQVEGFLRFRKDGRGDIGRVGRQQLFMAALRERLTDPLNLWRLPMVVGALEKNSKADIPRARVGQVLGALLTGPELETHLVPGDFGSRGSWAVDRSALRALVRERFE